MIRHSLLLLRRILIFILLGASTMTYAETEPATDPALTALAQRLRSADIPGIHSVIVQQHGKTLAEWYFEGHDQTIWRDLGQVKFTRETLHDVRSVTKSVVSMLFGIAMSEGAVTNLDAPVLDWFPEYPQLRTPERLRIRVRDVLSMTSGLHWDEWTYPYTDPRNAEIAMSMADDPYLYVLSQAVDAPPGTRWAYSGGDVALIGAVIARAVKMPIEQYAQLKLFGPLGMASEWSQNKGVAMAASGLRLTPRSMAVLGQLVLNQGRFDGAQRVPAGWMALSTTHKIDTASMDVPGGGYGYLWWLGNPQPDLHWIGAIGNGGQRIWVVPSRDLVVVITAGLYDTPNQGKAPFDILAAILMALPQP